MILNSIRHKVRKKTSMPNPAENLGCIKYYSLTSPRPIKGPTYQFYQIQLSEDLQLMEDLKLYWESKN